MNTDSAQRAFEVAVQVVKVDHFAVRNSGRRFVKAVQTLTREDLGPSGLALVKAYDDFARELAHTFHELEEEIVDRVQVLHLQKRMTPGVLSRSFSRWQELEAQLVSHGVALDELSARFSEVPVVLREPLSLFVATVHACIESHRASLGPALAPYFGGGAAWVA